MAGGSSPKPAAAHVAGAPHPTASEEPRIAQRAPSGSCTFASRALLERKLTLPSENHGFLLYLPRALSDRHMVAQLRRKELFATADPSHTVTEEAHLSAAAATNGTSRHDSPPGTGTPVAKLQNVAGRVWFLSQDPEGCRDVQLNLEVATSDEQRFAITRELIGHVAKALRHPHANHVLQKCITVNLPKDSQFVIDEILERPEGLHQAARHRYGCRIVQLLLQFCLPDQLDVMVEKLLADAIPLSRHTFGSYVMQQIFEHGRPEHRHRLVRTFEQNASGLASNAAGSRVIYAAIHHMCVEDGKWLARAVLQAPDALRNLADVRNGHLTLLAVLRALSSAEQEQAFEILGPESSEYAEKVSHLRALLREGSDQDCC